MAAVQNAGMRVLEVAKVSKEVGPLVVGRTEVGVIEKGSKLPYAEVVRKNLNTKRQELHQKDYENNFFGVEFWVEKEDMKCGDSISRVPPSYENSNPILVRDALAIVADEKVGMLMRNNIDEAVQLKARN
ncbi:hypothetical protein Ancab_006122 [Ancistrocladus abbreviatus]